MQQHNYVIKGKKPNHIPAFRRSYSDQKDAIFQKIDDLIINAISHKKMEDLFEKTRKIEKFLESSNAPDKTADVNKDNGDTSDLEIEESSDNRKPSRRPWSID